MDSRERTFLALNFEEPDRVPVDLWTSSGFERKISSELGMTRDEVLDRYDVDLRYIAGPEYSGPPLKTFADVDEDIWGVRRQSVVVDTDGGAESYREVAESPLASAATVEEVATYGHWPSPDWFDHGHIEARGRPGRRRDWPRLRRWTDASAGSRIC